jgi:hypothetical protein
MLSFFSRKKELPKEERHLEEKMYELLEKAIQQPENWKYIDVFTIRYIYDDIRIGGITIQVNDKNDYITIGDTHRGFTFNRGSDDYCKLMKLMDKLILKRMFIALGAKNESTN